MTNIAALGSALRAAAPDGALSPSEIRSLALLANRSLSALARRDIVDGLVASVAARVSLVAWEAFSGEPF
jgi:hypothetical protein